MVHNRPAKTKKTTEEWRELFSVEFANARPLRIRRHWDEKQTNFPVMSDSESSG